MSLTKTFMRSLKIATLALLLLSILLGIIYPFFIYGIGQVLFRHQAQGSLVYDSSGTIVGSELIAQDFQQPIYFHPRPSAAGDHGYDATQSSGSNLGATSKKWIDSLADRAISYRNINELSPTTIIPADAVTASGSGLDPHISIENALFQAPRIAKARKVPVNYVYQLLDEVVERSVLGFFGQKRVNVLRINMLLDQKLTSTILYAQGEKNEITCI